MSTEYTPTTKDVREAFGSTHMDGGCWDQEDALAFDRWLAEHDAAVKAEALEQAAKANREADQGFRMPPAMFADWLDEQAATYRKATPHE